MTTDLRRKHHENSKVFGTGCEEEVIAPTVLGYCTQVTLRLKVIVRRTGRTRQREERLRTKDVSADREARRKQQHLKPKAEGSKFFLKNGRR